MKIRGNTIGTTMKPEKTVVKCENLTEEEKAIARANIGAASADTIGDIESALDHIIEIQNSLINGGGQELVSFTVDDTPYSVPAGTTWEEIANQGLITTLGICIMCDEKRVLAVVPDGTMVVTCTGSDCGLEDRFNHGDDSRYVNASDCPIDGEAYFTCI